MRQEIKNKEPQGRQGYVPASVMVIELYAQIVLCGSINNPDDYPGIPM